MSTKFSDAALSQFSEQVVTVHNNRIDSEKRVTEGGDGAYVERCTMACDVRRYDSNTGSPYIVTGCKFILVTSYDGDDNETDAIIGGINGHPPICNQTDPADEVPRKSLPRKLAEHMAERADVKSWKFKGAADIGIPAARIEYETDDGTSDVVIAKDDEGLFELPAG